jgi:hypothetical protein
MGRPKKRLYFEPPGFRQAVRARFIEFGRRHDSRALRLLGTKVWSEEVNVREWAKSFNVVGTWVEQWAQDTLDAWRKGTFYPPPIASESGNLTMWYPRTRMAGLAWATTRRRTSWTNGASRMRPPIWG